MQVSREEIEENAGLVTITKSKIIEIITESSKKTN
jgi:hypothetical protein